MTVVPIAPDQSARVIRDETTSGEIGRGLAKTTFVALTSVTAATGLLCHPVTGSADFATSSPVFLVAEQRDSLADLWTSAVPVTLVARDAAAPPTRTDQDEVMWVKENSGLTWDQLGKVFGVSRRAVHLWANGGRMNESNSRALHDFGAAVRGHLQGAPDATRTALLAHGVGDLSVVDQFRMRSVVPAGESWGAPFTVEEKLDGRLEPLDRDW